MDLIGGGGQKAVVHNVTPNGVSYCCLGASYQLRLAPGGGYCQQLNNGDLRLSPSPAGKLVMSLDE